MFILIGVCPMADIQFPITVGKALSAQWWVLQKFCSVKRSDSPLPPNGRFAEDSYDWSIMSSIVGPSLDSVLPRTILPMEAAMVSRYTDLVELSQTILLALMLEILSVILSTADTSVKVLPPDRVGSGVLIWVAVLAKPWGRVEDCPTASALVGGNVGIVGAPGKWIGSQVGATWRNGKALPCILSIPSCQGIPMATGVFSHPSVGGPSTWLNRVTGGSWQLSMGLSISRPSRMSHLVMVTNSLMAWHSSLMLSARGWASGLVGR